MPRKKAEPTTSESSAASSAKPRAERPAAAEDISAPENVDANAADGATAATPDQTPSDAPSPTPALSPAPASVVSSRDPNVKAPTERVFLIDAMSHVFRAFFAPMGNRTEPLTNSAGQVTQAVFIFTNMLRKLLDDERPHYIAAVFEGGKTFREESFAAYKANRAEAPDDLKTQLPYIKRVCEAFNVPVLFTEGYEADDVIGTLAVQAAAQNLQAVIVSNDKDMCQLVRDPAVICMRHNSQNVKRKEPVPPVEWCDEAWVTAKFEVPPSQIIDLLGLMGDSVDNIPGAPGIGAKGAVAVVKQFGSIEAALERADEVKHKTYRESLKNNVEIIKQSKDLATIRTDAPIKLDLDQLSLKEPDRPAAYQLFRELEFKSLMREFADAATSPESGSGGGTFERRYTKITTRADLDSLVRRLYDRDNWGFALADTTPPDAGQQEGNRSGARPTGVAISLAPNSASYVDLENFDGGTDAAIDLLRDAFDNGLLSKCVHDSKRAVGLFDAIGISVEGIADDTLIAAYLLDPVRSKYDLADLAREAADFEFIPDAPDGWTGQAWRATQAADACAQSADVLRGRIAEQGLEQIYTDLELPLAPLLHRMEKAGLRVDRPVLDDLSVFLGTEIERLTKTIYEVAGREFKIGSPKQVGEVLEDLNITKGRKTSGGQISTARAVLDDLAAQGFELPKLIIEYRELDKLKTVYADSLPAQIAADGRIHGQLNQTTTATGRLSCLPAGTVINTQHGLIGIERVRTGDHVRTPYGARRVLAWQETGEKPVIKLKMSNGIVLRCSPEHRLRSRGRWIRADEIAPGAPVYMSYTKGIFGIDTELDLRFTTAYRTRKSPPLPACWTPELAEFVGYCMADGHIVRSNYNGKPSKIVLAFGWDDEELVAHFARTIEWLFGKVPTRRVTKSCVTLDLSSADIVGAVEQLGAGGKSGAIRVPRSLFAAPEEIVAAFLRGYYEGDGCATAQAHGVQVRSVSRPMLEDVQQLLTLFGIASTVRGGTPDPRGFAPRYTLALLGDKSRDAFAAAINFISQRKRQACLATTLKDRTRSAADSLTAPANFDAQSIKPFVYAPHRDAGERVPFPVMTFAHKLATGASRMTLTRAERIEPTLPREFASESADFIREVVGGQLFEINVSSIERESAVTMYDIAVEDVEQYMAQGIVVHNSSSPNLQNIPIRTELGRRIRRAFIPDEGNVLVTADYSQLELRLLAHVTRDEVMLDAFQKGDDVHSRTARLVFGAKTDAELKEKRRLAKIVNFAIAYAVEPYGLAARTTLSMKEAKQVIADYYDTYKGIRRYMDEVPAKAREAGHMRSIYGRLRPLPTINDRNPQVRGRAEREAINMPIQGCLPYETRVLTDGGYRRIGELYERGSRDLKVWTGTRFAEFEVLNRGKWELAELDFDNGQTLRCDTRHKVLVVGEDGYVWKSYGELAIGDRVCRSLPRQVESSYPRGDSATRFGVAGSSTHDLNAEFFYWLGYYFGDGWITHRDGRYSLAYSFGVSSLNDRLLVKTKADECATYFSGLGLRANFRQQSPQKGELTIYSKCLVKFLADSGIDTQARAATKRVPDLVFRAPLANRKAFLRGMLDADGCRGGDGATTPSIHLCQRPLLADLQLLFRTVGVESKLRGPYAHRGFVSHRLDLIGGMTGSALGYTDRRFVHVPDTRAPGFVVEAFLREVSPAQLKRHSHKVIYSRLKHGGTTSVHTLAAILATANVELSTPIYTWSPLRKKRALGVEEETYTLSVDDPLHRFDSEGIISKNTASDIVKSAMLRVDDALRAAGLRARMVMQVHDELLVEAPRDEAEQVAEIVKREMIGAANLDVPLEVEVGTGDNWMDAK